MVTQEQNWAGNYTYQATQWFAPETVEAVQDVIRRTKQVKGLGSRHSFNHIADSNDTIISMKNMNSIVELDTDNHTVTAEGGITYGQLVPYLHQQGYALHNLASLPHISVVGACMTGTHGSGEKNGNLATSVRALEIITDNGEIIRRNRDAHPDEFNGMVVSLGALGIVTKITLDVVPTYDVRQDVYLDLPLTQVLDNFDAIQKRAYSVSLFTKWENDLITQAWLKSKSEEPFQLGETFYGGKRATIPCSPVGDDKTDRCTEQLGFSGSWHERLPHFRMEFTPSHGEEIQSEYFVSRTYAVEAIQAINALHKDITPLLYISEIRTMTGDNLWLSPAYGQDTLAIHFTWKPLPDAIRPVLGQIEAALQPFNVRPHWGKVFTLSADAIQAQYERLDDFRTLVQRYSHSGKFHNQFLRDTIL